MNVSASQATPRVGSAAHLSAWDAAFWAPALSYQVGLGVHLYVEPLKNAACIRFAPQVLAHDTDAAKLVAGRADALLACVARAWYRRQASRPLEVRARMPCLHTLRCRRACLPHVLAGGGRAVELTYTGFL